VLYLLCLSIKIIEIFILLCYNIEMDKFPKQEPHVRYPQAKATEVAQGAEALQADAFNQKITYLESEVSSRYTPDSIQSTVLLDDLSLPNPLPDALSRYQRYLEVGAIKGVQIDFGTTFGTNEIRTNMLIALSPTTTRTVSIGRASRDSNAYTITEDGKSIDVNMSQSDIEGVLLTLVLPPHTNKLLEAQRVFHGNSALNLESPETFHLLSQVLRSGTENAVEKRQYSLPATELSTPSKIEIVKNGDHEEIYLFSGSTFLDRPDGVDEIQFNVSTVRNTALNTFGAIKIDQVTIKHNNSPVDIKWPLSKSVEIGVIETAIILMSKVIEALP
jgi:hypothetical protein